MSRTRLGVAAALGASSLALFLVAGQAGPQSSVSGKALPVLSTTDGLGYTSPCG
jgi:hypothetical protein